MTHDDLYPCTNCGRDNLYPGPCASCEHFIHPPTFDVAAVATKIKPLAVELGRHIVLPPAPEPRRPVDGDDVLAVGRWIRGGRP